MKSYTLKHSSTMILIVIIFLALLPTIGRSHCDTMNGPVVTAARKALETGNVNLVLVWVQTSGEAEVREAFLKTLAVRKLNPEVRELADMYFFENLVRIHRAGEGVAYTGLKPAETKPEPGIEAADEALRTGSLELLKRHLDESIHHGLAEQFERVTARKQYAPNDVDAGREYVKAYVLFIHYVERLHEAAAIPAEDHVHHE